MGGAASEENIPRRHLVIKPDKRTVTHAHPKNRRFQLGLPARGKHERTKLRHEFGERKLDEVRFMGGDPLFDTMVLETV